MAKMFVRVATKSKFDTLTKDTYKDSIVFIEDTQEIWTNNVFYAIPDAYKAKITNLETAQAALKYFSKISDGTNTYEANAAKSTIKIVGSGATTVTASADGFTVSTPTPTTYTLIEGSGAGTVNFNGKDVSVHGLGTSNLGTTLQEYYDSIADLNNKVDTAQSTADAKVASVKATTGTAIEVAGTATAPTVGLKLDNSGNVTLSQSATGLKASVAIPEDKVQGVKTGDTVLALGTDKMLSTTLSLDYNKTTKNIQLKGINGVVITELSASDFIKDGMLNGASFDPVEHNLTLTFNTDAGLEDIVVPLGDLVDVYDGSNLMVQYNGEESTLNSAIVLLQDDIAVAKTSGVTSFGGKTGAITVKNGNTANGTVNLTMSNKQLEAAVVGLKSAAFTESTAYATAAQGGKADSAIQNGATASSTYIKNTASKNGTTLTITPSLTIQAVSTASTSAKGVAEASDVKSYIDDLFAWEVIPASN